MKIKVVSAENLQSNDLRAQTYVVDNPVINELRLQRFLVVYRSCVILAHEKHPDHYSWPIEELDSVMDKIEKALRTGSYNLSGPAFKMTCKRFKLKWTRQAIEDFLRSPVTE